MTSSGLSLGFTPDQVLTYTREEIAYLDQNGRKVSEPLSTACINATKVSKAVCQKLTLTALSVSEEERAFFQLILSGLSVVSMVMVLRHEELSPHLKHFLQKQKERCQSALELLKITAEQLQEDIERAQQLLTPPLGASQWVMVGKEGEPDHN